MSCPLSLHSQQKLDYYESVIIENISGKGGGGGGAHDYKGAIFKLVVNGSIPSINVKSWVKLSLNSFLYIGVFGVDKNILYTT